ncbi:hypothetical protein G6F22_010700 [Rhizopus arrhizus]|nr:hypothetical protein G6F23_010984 [Rhizopus arrhizus]KAG0755713.1 hypothetical protein G6F24_011647 [Rhizopus arrhizus]KAG0779324.1 hypothetical protein G6F22_010700 [Rhizopus arrhizus]KAG0780587.1 hypothetical protein G6F21_012068 [Rhizopus arrhizus]KAG0804858.1 hypothetical protein G6F20_012366 [Rhizopus arrhizus]
MDYIVDQNEFIVETIATHTDYLKHAVSNESSSSTCPMLVEKAKNKDVRMKEAKTKRDYVRYTVQDKARFFELKIEKCMSASAAAKQLGIHIRTVQRWVKQYSMCPDNIFDSCKRVGQRIISYLDLARIKNYLNANPSAAVVEVTKYLLKRFKNLKVSRGTVYNFMRSECTRAVVTRPTTRANTTSILGAISAAGLIVVGVKKPRPVKKRKSDGYIISGTVTGHYISFLKTTLDEMDKHPHMKGHYIVMDNAPIHTHENINKYIEYRGYKCVYLPAYSPELNPIEQSWAVAKSKNYGSLRKCGEKSLQRLRFTFIQVLG